MKHSMIFQFRISLYLHIQAVFSPAVFFFFFYHRWSFLVGLSCGRPALHTWHELWLFDWGSTNSPNPSVSDRNRSPCISSPAVSGSGRPADCLQPLAFPGPILLLCLVDCCVPLLHLPLWPLLPSVSHGGIASTAQQQQQPDPHWATVCLASEMTEWAGATEAYWWLCSTTPPFPLPSLWPPHNDWPYHQSSWFNFQCFLHRWFCKLLS